MNGRSVKWVRRHLGGSRRVRREWAKLTAAQRAAAKRAIERDLQPTKREMLGLDESSPWLREFEARSAKSPTGS